MGVHRNVFWLSRDTSADRWGQEKARRLFSRQSLSLYSDSRIQNLWAHYWGFNIIQLWI